MPLGMLYTIAHLASLTETAPNASTASGSNARTTASTVADRRAGRGTQSTTAHRGGDAGVPRFASAQPTRRRPPVRVAVSRLRGIMIYQQLMRCVLFSPRDRLHADLWGVNPVYFAHGEIFTGSCPSVGLVVFAGFNIYVLLGATVFVAIRPVPRIAPLISTIGHHCAQEIRGLFHLRRPACAGGSAASSARSRSARPAVPRRGGHADARALFEHSKMGRATAVAGRPTATSSSPSSMSASRRASTRRTRASRRSWAGAAVKGLIVTPLGGLGKVPGAMVAGLTAHDDVDAIDGYTVDTDLHRHQRDRGLTFRAVLPEALLGGRLHGGWCLLLC